jgi:hypothetical protein
VEKLPVTSLLPAQPSPDDGDALNLRAANHLGVFPPLAWQDDAFVADHCRTAEPPALTDVGVAVKFSVGAMGCCPTATVTDCVVEPPAPAQARV